MSPIERTAKKKIHVYWHKCSKQHSYIGINAQNLLMLPATSSPSLQEHLSELKKKMHFLPAKHNIILLTEDDSCYENRRGCTASEVKQELQKAEVKISTYFGVFIAPV